MGNSHKTLPEEIEDINNLTANKKFKELTGLNLSFSIVLLNPVKFLGRVINKNDLRIQISYVERHRRSFSEIGTLTLENFHKFLNIIQHLLSFTVNSDADPDQEEDKNEERLCSICLDNEADTILECGHQFCFEDLQSWESKNQECPLCRQNFSVSHAFILIEGFPGEVIEEVRVCKEELFKLIEF